MPRAGLFRDNGHAGSCCGTRPDIDARKDGSATSDDRFVTPVEFAEKGDKQEEDEIGIDLRLKLEVAREIFGCDFARAAFELKRGMQRVIDFFDKHDERPDIAIGQSGTRVVLFELFN